MPFVVCCVPVSPMRAESSHKSEMISQLLLGEGGELLDEAEYFVKLRGRHDGYEGWCQRSQVAIVDAMPGHWDNNLYVGDWTDKVLINGVAARVPMGTPVLAPAQEPIQAGPYRLAYAVGSAWNAATAKPTPEAIKARAERFLNTPYLWGGRSIFGIDCSGFCQTVYRFFNIPLLRDAYLQATQGESVGFLQEVKCGDLAFFDNAEGRITHVGILLNESEIIHASGKVRIDKIDNAGIINTDTGLRTHQLRIIKRYF
ncbi:C40 family peptidase [Paraflavitalea sp. CAU 1676]|uniref:C40 family peptidase n=1 Tax=Paraflavitalea sp. CAU 1676 TaxID=3032598 RepID=UPI0023DB8DF3|nr:C40 family peptidase [Paraflavitalea sp. CAU 1676]MDF2189489.1 C40 family peptidase [Paraflavitalea sp. CAU 1676]